MPSGLTAHSEEWWIKRGKASTGGPVSRGDTIAGGFLLLLDRDVLLNTFQAADLVRIEIYFVIMDPPISYLFPFTSNSLQMRIHHKIMPLNPTEANDETSLERAKQATNQPWSGRNQCSRR